MTYADTSALLKLLVAEPETPALHAHLAGAPGEVLTCDLTIAELTRNATRAGASPATVDLLLGQLTMLTLDRSLLTRAGRLPSPPGTFLRTADAIHLVAALEVGATTFLSYDRRQAQAAAGLGFAVLAPGRPDDWLG